MSDNKMMHRVICPCCKGAKHLEINDEALGHINLVVCCHCMAEGTVRSEMPEPPQSIEYLEEAPTRRTIEFEG